MMPLLLGRIGERMKVIEIRGKEDVCTHLKNLGFVPGADVYITARNAGNMIINIKDSRIAIDEKLAGKIQVEA